MDFFDFEHLFFPQDPCQVQKILHLNVIVLDGQARGSPGWGGQDETRTHNQRLKRALLYH